MSQYTREITAGERFEFGKNWTRFLDLLSDERIAAAQQSLGQMFEVDSLNGKRFLDIGSGSGLFSLAARRLGARVHSFDYDPQSVACTEELKRRYFSGDDNWIVEEGNVLDLDYLDSLGKFDMVYAWGVLHHTGEMWRALGNVAHSVDEGGFLYLSIYNDQGRASRYWKRVKKLYNKLPKGLKFLVLWPTLLRFWGPKTLRDLSRGKLFYTWKNYDPYRGMSPWRDVVDWVGGHPFEVARPEEIFDFFRKRSFALIKLKTCAGGLACNEFVFVKERIKSPQ